MSFPLFLIPILVGLTAQFSKRFFNKRYFSEIKLQGIPLPRYGGMPSAHTAFACSLATVVAMADGITSSSFAIASVLVIFILDDALRMRIFLGRHGAALQRLIRNFPKDEQRNFPHLESRLGHKPAEVIAGGALGVTLTAAIMLVI